VIKKEVIKYNTNLRPLKYIFLSPSSKGKNLKYYDLNNDFIFVGSWAGLLARRLKKYKPELDISIWIMEPFVNRPLPKKVFDLDGIIWPYKNVLIKNILSFSMYLMILRLSLRNNIILHYHSLFDRFILLKYFLPGNVKIVLSHHGGRLCNIVSVKLKKPRLKKIIIIVINFKNFISHGKKNE